MQLQKQRKRPTGPGGRYPPRQQTGWLRSCWVAAAADPRDDAGAGRARPPEARGGPGRGRAGPGCSGWRVLAAAMSCLREEDDPYLVEEPSDEERALSRCGSAPASLRSPLSPGVSLSGCEERPQARARSAAVRGGAARGSRHDRSPQRACRGCLP